MFLNYANQPAKQTDMCSDMTMASVMDVATFKNLSCLHKLTDQWILNFVHNKKVEIVCVVTGCEMSEDFFSLSVPCSLA